MGGVVGLVSKPHGGTRPGQVGGAVIVRMLEIMPRNTAHWGSRMMAAESTTSRY
ncbi:MAG: hypothetical protein VCE75_10705 [Alphaproteobacteria bacterium]